MKKLLIAFGLIVFAAGSAWAASETPLVKGAKHTSIEEKERAEEKADAVRKTRSTKVPAALTLSPSEDNPDIGRAKPTSVAPMKPMVTP